LAKKKQTKDISVKKKILALESIYGQKETARRLGVTPATLINWKKNDTIPAKKQKQEKKLNYVYGHNKKKATFSDIKKTFRQERKKAERKKEKLLDKKRTNRPNIVSSKSFVTKQVKDKNTRQEIMSNVTEYVATFGDTGTGQFVTGFDITSNYYGIPKRTKYVVAHGLYSNHYQAEHDDSYKGYYKEVKIPMLDTFSRDVPLDQALEIVEGKFLSTVNNYGKRKDYAIQFVGYQLP
jgi:hypothetical protein